MSTTIAPPASGAVDLSDVQGLVARSYLKLTQAAYVLLHFDGDDRGAGARRWIGGLKVTTASQRSADVLKDGTALNVAFTSDGLKALGLSDDTLHTFSIEFQQGMAEEHRQRVLGDLYDADPKHWVWGGPTTEKVHAVLLLFAKDEAGLDALYQAEEKAAAAAGVRVLRRLPTITLPEDKEHFGFHDGIAQPRVAGFRPDKADDLGETNEAEIPPGEVVLGYENAYSQVPDSPWVPETADPKGLLHPLPPDPDAEYPAPLRDLGKNGSYLVFRQLEQDVKRFWASMDERAGGDPDKRKFLASKIVGRWPNGAPLVVYPDQEPAGYDPMTMDGDKFLYVKESSTGAWKGGGDPHGDKCPLGAHVRRSNPRDGMAPGPEGSLIVADRHRMLRRGRAYGPPLAPTFDPADILKADGPEAREERGLHFLCFNTDIVRQFEFVQNTWTNSMKFDGLYNDPDPLVAPHIDPDHERAKKNPELVSNFTEPRCPVRHRETKLPRFVLMRGGAYFFLPGIKALRYLSELS